MVTWANSDLSLLQSLGGASSPTTISGEMAASASDIRSALSIPSQPQNLAQTPAQSKKLQAQSSRKPDGISRELYSLIGPSAPSLAAQLAKPKLKQKPNLGSRSVVKW